MTLGSLQAGHSQPSRSAGLVTTSCAGSHRGALSAGCLLGCAAPLHQPASQPKALRECLMGLASLRAGHSQPHGWTSRVSLASLVIGGQQGRACLLQVQLSKACQR